MRIALISLHFAEYAARLALALAENHEVLLALREDNAGRELSDSLVRRLEDAPGLRLIKVKARPLKDLRMFAEAYRLYAQVRAFQPDVVHCQEFFADYCALPVLALWCRYPGVLTVHDHVTHSGADSGLGSRARRYRGWLRGKADRWIVHGEIIRAELQENDSTLGDCVDAIPHGVLGADCPPFSISDAEPTTLLFFGRIEEYKGLGDLLTACETLVARGIALHLLIAGRGSDLNTHRSRISDVPWVELQEDYISTEDVPSLFRRAAIVVLPYTDATQSGVAALAFAFGRPVLATNTGALPEVVIPGRTGMLVPPGAPAQLAEALAQLLADRHQLERLATGAAEFARTELNWTVIAQRTTTTYAATVKQRGARLAD